MKFLSLLWQFYAFVIMKIFETVTNVADEVMFTLADNEVYGEISKVRNVEQGPDEISL